MEARKKLQVFISSTYVDLLEERQAAVEAILKAGHIPAGMELFTASNKSQWEIIKRWIDESDIYMLILGGRYGSIEQDSGKSYTHLEYEYAQSIDKPLFAVVIKESALGSRKADDIEKDNPEKLSEFRNTILSYMSSFFTDNKDIKLAVHESMGQITQDYDLVGWIRGNNQSNNFANEMLVLNDEMRKLREQNERLKAEQVTRTPKIKVLINNGEKIEIQHYINEFEFYQVRESIKKIPHYLESYLSQETVNDYNDLISVIDEEAIQKYNEIKARKFSFLKLQNSIKIKLSNLGNLKANNVHVYILFPDFVHVLKNKDTILDSNKDLDRASLRIIPEPSYDPLADAEAEYLADIKKNAEQNAVSIADLVRTANKVLDRTDFLTSSIRPNFQSTTLAKARTFDKTSYNSVKDNQITIKISDLLHGLSTTLSNYILIPLSKDSGLINIRIYCEEYIDNESYNIPITVS